MADIVIIGGINIDIEGYPYKDLVEQDSNPGRIKISYGGVGRNIAENAARIGEKVAMLSVIGADELGRGARSHLAGLGVDVSMVREIPGRGSAIYLSILNPNRDMHLGLCDMEIIQELTAADIRKAGTVFESAAAVALDGNLEEEMLRDATEILSDKMLFYDPVSANKAHRAKACIGRFHSIKPNLIAAANAVTLAKLQLKVLMGITADVEIKINDNLTNYETTMFANQLKEENVNLNNNTTMKQLDLNMKLLEKNVKSLKTNFMPTLSMSFSYQYQSLYNPNINFFDYNWSNSSSLMFNISIPLYKASNFTKVKSARIQMRQLDWNRIDTERQLNMQIVSCRNNMSASTEQVVSNKENVMQAKKAVVIAEKRYDVGKGTVLELNSSQVSLTQAQLTYNQSIYDYLVAKADLDQVLGKE